MLPIFKPIKIIPDDRKISDLWLMPYASGAVTAAVESGLTEALKDKPQSARQLADRLLLHHESVLSVLRVMVAMGFVRESGGRFALEAAGSAYLVPSSPLSRNGELSRHFETLEHKFVLQKLQDIGGNRKAFGAEWKIASDDSHVEEVALGMDSLIKASAISVIRSGAFKGVDRLLDVGGGSGALAVALTEHQPETEVTILDLPAMCKQAKKWVDKRNAKNIHFYPADFFKDPWAFGCDAINFSNVLHDWPAETALELLIQARQVVKDRSPKTRGRLYILEVLRNETRNGPLMATIFHMQMQMAFGGAQYTRSDLAKMCKKARFSEPKAVAKFGYYSLLKAESL